MRATTFATVFVQFIFLFFDAGLGLGKLCLQAVYLHVLLAYDAIKPSYLLVLLGVGLLKFAQTTVYLAQHIVYVGTLSCHSAGKDSHLLPNRQIAFHIL